MVPAMNKGLPVVDFAGASDEALARQLDAAFSEIGFCYFKGIDVDPATVKDVFAAWPQREAGLQIFQNDLALTLLEQLLGQNQHRAGDGHQDRGLGVKPEQLAEANRRLAEPPEYDLADTDQLGLFVVARLAARHDISVTLQRSPYGGVTAIVLFPHELVVPAEEMAAGVAPPADAPHDETAALTGTAVEGAPGWEPTIMAAPVPEGVVPLRDSGAPGELAALPADDPHQGRRNAPGHLEGAGGRLEAPPALPALTGPAAPAATPAPAEDPAPAAPVAPWGVPDGPAAAAPPRPAPNPWSDDAHTPAAEGPGGAVHEDPAEAAGEDWQPAGTHAGLPRRVRQRNLAPQLRKRPPSPPPTGGTATGAVARSPEEARSLMASIQQGWRRGRASDVGDEGTR